jgi:hypothetical protein
MGHALSLSRSSTHRRFPHPRKRGRSATVAVWFKAKSGSLVR